jgi:hypothetical protein
VDTSRRVESIKKKSEKSIKNAEELEDIILSKVSQAQKTKNCMFSLI